MPNSHPHKQFTSQKQAFYPPHLVISTDPDGSGEIPQASHLQTRASENDTSQGPLDFACGGTMWKMPCTGDTYFLR